jgi:L-iditol 2-dehydrogenase
VDPVRAARLYGAGDIRVVDEPPPTAEPGTCLVRVTAVGLCGSDLHWYAEAGIGDARLDRPLVVGHEMAGVIVDGPRAGQRVAIDPAIPCQACRMCGAGHHNLCPAIRFAGHGSCDGGLREAMAWPTSLLHPLPDALSDADGAMLEPLGVALHALDLGRPRVGARVAVVGAGPIGLLLVRAARLAGASTVVAVEPLPHRRRAAATLGADETYTPDEADAAWGSDAAAAGSAEPADVVFEVAGSDAAVHTALLAARPGARVVLVGIPDSDTTTFVASLARRKGLTLVLSRRMNDAYPRAADLVARGLIDVASLVSDRFPLDRTADAFAAAQARAGLKVVVEPHR